MNMQSPTPQSMSQISVQSLQDGASLADDEELIELLADDLASEIVENIAPHAIEYVESRSSAELQSLSTDFDGAVGNNEEIDEIADEVSDSLVEPLGDTLAEVQTASLESSTSSLAMQAAGGIEQLGFRSFFKKVGRGIKKVAKKAGGFIRKHGKPLLKEAAGFALRSAIGLFSAMAPSGVQQQGLGSFLRRAARKAAPFVKKGLRWIRDRVKDKAKDLVREGLRRVHQIADERIQSLSAGHAPAQPSDQAPGNQGNQAPWITTQSALAIVPQGSHGGSIWKNPAFA